LITFCLTSISTRGATQTTTTTIDAENQMTWLAAKGKGEIKVVPGEIRVR